VNAVNAAGAMALFVITTKTKDYGEKFVVREHFWIGRSHTARAKPLAVVDGLVEARKAITKAMGRDLLMLDRQRGDDPVVVESWGSPLVIRYLQHLGRTQ